MQTAASGVFPPLGLWSQVLSSSKLFLIYFLFNFQSSNVKTVNIGGTPKHLVNNQFNSPIGLYSDDAIADAVVLNPAIVQSK